MPTFRNLWENIRWDMPKKGRRSDQELDPLSLSSKLQTAIDALYGHYAKTFDLWQSKGIKVSPCFIILERAVGCDRFPQIRRGFYFQPVCRFAGFSELAHLSGSRETVDLVAG